MKHPSDSAMLIILIVCGIAILLGAFCAREIINAFKVHYQQIEKVIDYE